MPTERVSVRIDGERYEFWSAIEIRLALDTFSTVTLTAPFEPKRKEFRQVFRPFSFKPLQIDVGDKRLFTGTLVGVHPEATPEGATVEVTGYSLPGVLEDCTAPAANVPHEYKKLGLRAIAEAIAAPFGLKVRFRADEGAKFDKVALEEEQRLFAFLSELARQRNVVWSSTPEGDLLCWQSVEPGNPVARFVEGESPVSVVRGDFSPQEYFSEITGFCASKRGRKGSKHTVKNPWLPRVIRPMSFKLDDTEPADTPEATRSKLGRMFGQIAAFTMENLPTWRDPNGDLWNPNTTLMLTAPSAMIYRRSELLARTVTLKQTAESETAELGLVLPGAYSGKAPTFMPWDEPI